MNVQIRKRLTSLLADDRPEGDALMRELRELRDTERSPICSHALHLLTHLSLPDPQAESLMMDLLTHRGQMAEALGRDPGLRVAAIDYLSNVNPLLSNPTIVETKQLEATEKSALTDSLTRLSNRRHFMRALALETRRSQRYSLRLSLLMMDLDAFKELNDRNGHLFGDLILQRVGQVLRQTVRDPDIAARFGGDEFAVILPETERLGCFAVAQRIRRKIEQSFAERPVSHEHVRLTVSGGIASFPEDGRDPEALVARADKALYLSKSRGKDRISLFHAERRSAIRYPAKSSARVRVRDGVSDESRTLHPVNVSCGGVLLEVETEAWATPSSVELTFGGRDASGRPRSWVASGRVVRTEGGDESSPERHVAVAFERPLSEDCLRQQVRHAQALVAEGQPS